MVEEEEEEEKASEVLVKKSANTSKQPAPRGRAGIVTNRK